MNDLQLQIKTGEITTNLDDLKKELSEIADRYQGVVVTEDTIKVAKDDLASLRKVKDSIETRRKEIKKQWNEPYNKFESEVKAALEVIEKPISEIDKQLKAFAKAEKEAKEQKCKEIYGEQVSDEYKPYLPFEKVFDESWLNKSTSEKTIISDINTAVTQIQIDLDGIKALNSEIEDDCLKAYKDAGNSLAAAIKRNTDYLNAKAAAEVRAREEAERKVREEQERKEREEQVAREEAERAEQERQEQPTVTTSEQTDEEPTAFVEEIKGQFHIIGAENIEKAKELLNFNEIPFRYVEG